MKKILLVILSIFFAFASENEDFLQALNEVSEIATQTKINIDKAPSNVDVIRRDFIKKSGAKTLLDVLKYIPGVELSMSSSGKKELIIRGNKSTYRDKIKFMINGVEVTNNLYTNQFYYYNFPASLIKRVEFTKTPDSVLYGGNAFLGVINIITVDELEDDFVNFYISNKKEYVGSLFKKFKNDKLLIDAYYSYSKPDITAPTSYLADIKTYTAIPYRSGVKAHTLEKNIGLGVTYKEENYNIKYRLQFYEKGNFFGISRITPLKHDKTIKLIHQYLNYNYSKYLQYNLKNSFDAGVKYYIWDGEFRTIPYDFNETIDNNPDNDIIAGAKVNEIEYYLKDSLRYESDLHNIVFVFETKYAKPFDYYYLQYVESMNGVQNAVNLGPNKKHLTGDKNALKEGIHRFVYSFGAQDLITLNDKFSLIGGARYDDYNDFGSKISYKLGGVYNFSSRTTFKLLFNSAYRVPSWVELYSKSATDFNGNEDLKPETIDMLEAIFIKKITDKDKIKLVYFYGVNRDYIGRKIDLSTGKRIYENLGDYHIRGGEFSYDRYDEKYHFNFSYSLNKNYYDFEMNIKGIDYYDWPGNREHLIKSFLNYRFNEKCSAFVGSVWGSKIKTPIIKDINPYFTLNANVNFKYKDYDFRVGVDNITNHKNYYWIDPSDLIAGRYFFEFDGAKVPEIGRKIYLTIEKSW